MIGNVSRRVREGDAGKGPKGTSPASYLGLKGQDPQRLARVTIAICSAWNRFLDESACL